jgi:hypothetical protein
MIKWHSRWLRLALVVGAIGAWAVAAGAGIRWW